MVAEDVKKILEVLAEYFTDNTGNKLNKWLTIPIMNVMKTKLEEVAKKDAEELKKLKEDYDELKESCCDIG